LTINIPPRVFPFKVEFDVPLKVPPPDEVRITEASVRFPEASVMITVMVVVAPAAMELLPGNIVTLAGVPPELPDPEVVPLVTLLCLLTSEASHPGKIKRAAPSKKNININEIDLCSIVIIPNY
jgi:hypothetical protein